MSTTPKKSSDPYSPLKEGEEAHWEVGYTRLCVINTADSVSFVQVVERILFLYAKTNKGIGYVQVNGA